MSGQQQRGSTTRFCVPPDIDEECERELNRQSGGGGGGAANGGDAIYAHGTFLDSFSCERYPVVQATAPEQETAPASLPPRAAVRRDEVTERFVMAVAVGLRSGRRRVVRDAVRRGWSAAAGLRKRLAVMREDIVARNPCEGVDREAELQRLRVELEEAHAKTMEVEERKAKEAARKVRDAFSRLAAVSKARAQEQAAAQTRREQEAREREEERQRRREQEARGQEEARRMREQEEQEEARRRREQELAREREQEASSALAPPPVADRSASPAVAEQQDHDSAQFERRGGSFQEAPILQVQPPGGTQTEAAPQPAPLPQQAPLPAPFAVQAESLVGGTPDALAEAQRSTQLLREAEECEGIASQDPRAAPVLEDIKKRVRLAVNQISAADAQVHAKIRDLCDVLADARGVGQRLHVCAMRLIARDIVNQGDDQVAQFLGSCFAISSVAVGVALETAQTSPMFLELLMAEFHAQCIMTVPLSVRRPGRTDDAAAKWQYRKAMGFREEKETFETFSKRTAGTVALWAAFLQTRIPSGRVMPAGGTERWRSRARRWLEAAVVDPEPGAYWPCSMLAFLEVAGQEMENWCGDWMLQTVAPAVLTTLARVRTVPAVAASVARLQSFIQEALEHGRFKASSEARTFLQ